jgi:hypothetical protein
MAEEQHGSGMGMARHGMCELAFNVEENIENV